MACQYLAILVAFALLGQGSARDMLTVKAKPILGSSKPVADNVPTAATMVSVAALTSGFSLKLVVNLDCPTTCSKAGLSSINGGTSGQALCVRERDGATFYGLWSQADKRCYYIKDKEVWYAVSGYKCACVSSSTSLGWEANTACASSPRAASTSPPICRFSKPNSNGPWTMGWYDTRAGICYARGKGFSPDGRTVIGVTRLGGSYNAQLLCVTPTPWCPICQVHSKSAGGCVADTNKEGWSCCSGGKCRSGYCTGIPFATRVGTCQGTTVESCDGWNSNGFCSGCTARALYKVATGAIPYLHPASDYPTRDARITMAAVATYWSLSEGVFNKISNVIGYNNCENCKSGNNYISATASCNTLACTAAVCPAKKRQCTWQVGIGAPQVVNSGYSTSIDYVCTSSLAPSLSYLRPLSNLPCVQETALKAYAYKLSITQILTNVAKAAGVSPSDVLAKTTNCKVSDAECAKRGSTDPYLANCQCQLDRKAWLLRDPAVSITYGAYEWFADRRVPYGTTSALPSIAGLKAIYQCLSPP